MTSRKLAVNSTKHKSQISPPPSSRPERRNSLLSCLHNYLWKWKKAEISGGISLPTPHAPFPIPLREQSIIHLICARFRTYDGFLLAHELERQRIYQRKFRAVPSPIPRKSRLAPVCSRDDGEGDDDRVDAPSNYRRHTNQTPVFPAAWQRILTRCAFRHRRRLEIVIDELRVKTTQQQANETCTRCHLTNLRDGYIPVTISRILIPQWGPIRLIPQWGPIPIFSLDSILFIYGTLQFGPFKLASSAWRVLKKSTMWLASHDPRLFISFRKERERERERGLIDEASRREQGEGKILQEIKTLRFDNFCIFRTLHWLSK